MPSRRTATKSPMQSMLSFRTPSKITKSQTPHSGIKNDITSTLKKPVAISPHPADLVPAAPPQQERVQEEEPLATRPNDDPIGAYYKNILLCRYTSPLHQEGLPLEEKVLRHFDMSLQYGPCVGISRLARWKRAKMLEMEPPVEVLAVCLKIEKEARGMEKKAQEEGGGEVVGCGAEQKRDTRRSYLDDLLSTRILGEHGRYET